MLMMLSLLARNGWKGPTDAHDAGPFGPESLERSQVMLMMLGVFGAKRLERSQLMLMMLGLLAQNGWKGPS